jgi:hypothetical protein
MGKYYTIKKNMHVMYINKNYVYVQYKFLKKITDARHRYNCSYNKIKKLLQHKFNTNST